MVRKSSVHILLISLLLFLPGQLLSLGLGEIEVDSALNQPLNAQINLISARADELEEMRVELAPANVFDRVGVPRPYFLTQLKFTPVSLPGGGTAIRVTSKDPVREPFLTFLVEVTWPKGRLLREYTVLLDPPEFAQQQAPQIATPVTTPVIQEQVIEAEPVVATEITTSNEVIAESTTDIEVVREQIDRELGIDDNATIAVTDEVVEEVETIEPVTAEPIEVEPTAEIIEDAVVETVVESQPVMNVADDVIIPEDIPGSEEVVVNAEEIEAEVIAESEVYTQASVAGEHVVVSGDTLFKIAKDAKSSNAVSINQMMIAIQQANPDAFSRNNVNLLKKGAVLRIPDAQEAQSASSAEARKMISQQNALWREYRGNVSQVAAKNIDAPELVDEKSEVVNEAKQALKETAKKADAVKQDLNILAAEDGKQSDSNMQIAGGEEIKKLQNEVTLTKELAESKGKEAEELKSRVEALESMLEKKEKILNIQNQQLKDLQEQLGTEANKAAAAEKMLKEKAAQEITKPVVKPEAKPVAKPIEKPVVEEIKKPIVEPLPEFAEPILVEQPVATPRLEPLPDWDSLPEIELKEESVAEVSPAEKPAEVKPVQKPAEVKQVEAPNVPENMPEAASGVMGFATSLIERFKSVLLPLVGGALLLLGGLWFWRKKSVKTVELSGLGEMPMELGEDDDHFDDILDETIVTPQTNAAPEISDDAGTMDDLGLDDEDMGFTPTTSEADGDTELGEDVLDEADVYISYGLHQQAQDLLTDAIANEPNNNDYKAKLAEVYYSQKDSQAFEQYAEKIKGEVGETSSQWQNILSMGKELAPSSALFAGAAALGVAAKAAVDKPDEADVDIGLQTVIDNPLSDANLEDTFLDNDASDDNDDGLDFNIDDPMADDIEDDPVASKIMEANETSDILNFEVDDLSDDILEDDDGDGDADTVMDAMATGLHETASMDDLTQELEQIGMQTTMNDLKPLDLDESAMDDDLAASLDDTVAMQSDDFDIDTALTPADPEETAAYKPSSLEGNFGGDDTEQFDVTNMDTEFLDPAEQTVAQTHTDLQELGPPSLIEEVGTKLDLAKAFVDMGDSDAAKETLLEVINEGDESQIKAAKDLMDKLGS
ncbi:MAG: FimV/HubP family polar landmark protein [Gammaproteobacteria bacterium]